MTTNKSTTPSSHPPPLSKRARKELLNWNLKQERNTHLDTLNAVFDALSVPKQIRHHFNLTDFKEFMKGQALAYQQVGCVPDKMQSATLPDDAATGRSVRCFSASIELPEALCRLMKIEKKDFNQFKPAGSDTPINLFHTLNWYFEYLLDGADFKTLPAVHLSSDKLRNEDASSTYDNLHAMLGVRFGQLKQYNMFNRAHEQWLTYGEPAQAMFDALDQLVMQHSQIIILLDYKGFPGGR